MKPDEPCFPMMGALKAIEQLLAQTNSQGIIIGGIAVSLLGRARFTEDIDAIIFTDEERLPEFLEIAKKYSLIPRINNVEEFASRTRVLLLQYAPDMLNVDISLGALPFEKEAMERSQLVKSGGVSFRIPTPEDLVIMKALARRPKDYEDIRGIVLLHPDMDKKRIEHWVRQFASTLEMPEIWKDLREILEN
jgi:predicted nucleotidyltransferase